VIRKFVGEWVKRFLKRNEKAHLKIRNRWALNEVDNGAPRAKPVLPQRRPQGANIPYQRTNSPTGRTRGPLGSG